jgi:hypothetical protein
MPIHGKLLLYAFGFELTAKPRSLPAHAVYARLEKVVDGFRASHRDLCEFLAILRNAHLHTADLPFGNLKPTKWLPRFYETVKVLNSAIGKESSDFLGPEMSATAEELIKSLSDEVLKAVKTKISGHKRAFSAKLKEEQEELLNGARMSTGYIYSHKDVARACPACGAQGVLSGIKVKEFQEKYEEGELLMDVQYLANGFNCSACSLELKGEEEIAHSGLSTHFIRTNARSLHELYEPDHYQEYNNM